MTGAQEQPASLSLQAVAKHFGPIKAVDGIDLDVGQDEFFALLGPSGCGKTTLLRIIAGLERPTAGRVVIGSRDLTALPTRPRGVAMVFQNYAVFPHMTVFENIAFGLRMQKAAAARVEAQVKRAADLLHIAPY